MLSSGLFCSQWASHLSIASIGRHLPFRGTFQVPGVLEMPLAQAFQWTGTASHAVQHHGSIQWLRSSHSEPSRPQLSLPPSHDRTPQANTATGPGLCRHPPNSRSGRRGLPTSSLPWCSPHWKWAVSPMPSWRPSSRRFLGPCCSRFPQQHPEGHPRGACRRTGAVSGPVMIQRADGLSGPCLHRVLFRLAMASPISPVWPCLLPTRPLLPTSSSANQAAPLRLIRHI